MIDALAIIGDDGGEGTAVPTDHPRLLVIGRIGDRRFALPAAAVVYCLRMAAVTPVPDAPRGVVGVLNLSGVILPVVDPRPWFDLDSPPFHPEQYLVLVRAQRDYLLWVDRLEQTFTAHADDVRPLDLAGDAPTSALAGVGADSAGGRADGRPPLVTSLVRIAGEVVPVLSVEVLTPGTAR
jgi:purine-binding chemotaxis protein CheW